jgi:hypothetical protein
MANRSGITVSYFGVNQAYQLALAAQELGELDAFYCSLYDAPGKWGGLLKMLLGDGKLVSRRCAGLDPKNAVEIPGPVLCERLRARLPHGRQAKAWFETSCAFDREVSRRLGKSDSRLFVGVETCAELSLARARELGMKTMLDCHGVGADFLDATARRAAEKLGLPTPVASDSAWMSARKAQELALADQVTVCSELQRRLLEKQGLAPAKISVVALWADPELWFPAADRRPSSGPLKVIFAGKISLRKGVPYLLKAVASLGGSCELDLVGPMEGDLSIEDGRWKMGDGVRMLPPQTKQRLRELYWQHDVLVLPSLGDSFGFVAMEAMACGLPVIVTENCGVPVPDPCWRVPVMDSEAIARRLEYYTSDREALERDRLTAQGFSRQFTPERYRGQIKSLFRGLLENEGGEREEGRWKIGEEKSQIPNPKHQ